MESDSEEKRWHTAGGGWASIGGKLQEEPAGGQGGLWINQFKIVPKDRDWST